MLCTNCGFKVRKGVKRCKNCGSQVDAQGSSVSAIPTVESIELAPLAADLAICNIEILDVTATACDDGGAVNVTAKYKLMNDQAVDWDYLVVQMQVLNAFGHVIDETSDEIHQKIPAGQSEEFEANFYGINSALFSGAPERAFTVASVIASNLTTESLGPVDLPDATLSTAPLKPVTIGGTLKLISGSVWRGAEYGHNENSVNACVLMQSVTNQSLSRVNLGLKVSNSSDIPVYCDFRTLDSFAPGTLAAVQFQSDFIKKKKLAGVSVQLEFDFLTPVACGLTQRRGIWVIASDSTADDDDVRLSDDTTEDVEYSDEPDSTDDECPDPDAPDGLIDTDTVDRWRTDFYSGKVRNLKPFSDVQAIFANEGMSEIARVVRAYLGYAACSYCKLGELEEDQCDMLTARDGPYSEIMAAVFEEAYGQPYNDEEGPASIDYFWDYILAHQSEDDIAAFLYRYLLSMRRSGSSEINFEIPFDFDDRKIEILKHETERAISQHFLWAYERTLND